MYAHGISCHISNVGLAQAPPNYMISTVLCAILQFIDVLESATKPETTAESLLEVCIPYWFSLLS